MSRPRRQAAGHRLHAAALVVVGVLLIGAGPRLGEAKKREPAPAPPSALAAVRSASAALGGERQSALLADESQRLLTLVSSVRSGSPPYVQTEDGVDTVVLTAGGTGYDLADLEALGAADVTPEGDVLLTRSVFVAPGARLTVEAPGRSLRLRSEQSGFVSLVAWKAELQLAGASGRPLQVTSWDPGAGTPDTSVVDGRAYVRDVSGRMSLSYVGASDLGFWAGRTSGMAWTGSSRTPATGSIVGSTFRANHYGAFVSQGEQLTVLDSTFDDNAVDGLALHRSTAQTTIESSAARRNGRHGFSADQGSEAVTLTQVTAAENAAHGVYFSGAPLADGQSAGGASLRTYGDLRVTGGLFQRNGGTGLRIVDGRFVDVSGALVDRNRDGVVLVGTTAPTTVQDTVFSGGQRFGISVSSGAATLAGNRVGDSATAIRVRDAAVTATGNTVGRATAHGISVVGAADGTVLRHNRIAGRGPSAIDDFRLAADAAVEQAGNDVDGWTRDRDDAQYWASFVPNHPMLLLWVVVLGVPLVLALRRRRHPAPLGTAPYRDDLRRERPAALRVDVGRRVAPGGTS